MRITIWNINGVRAALNKGAGAWFQSEKPDVLCLQEIKARPEQLSEEQARSFSGFHSIWNSAQRPGYSGVATFSKNTPDSIELGIELPAFDTEGRVIRTRYADCWLFNIYFPNGGRDHERVKFKLDFYARLLEMCDEMHARGEKIIIGGDFNTAHREIDLRYPKQNVNTTGFMPEERVWIDTFLAHGFVDAFRQLYPERVQYTWWTYRLDARQRNIGWRLDYFMVSAALMPRVQDIVTHEAVLGSDHCPVTLSIDV
jgi:exodeoxyribonuclease-3